MAITIDPATKVISIAQADLTFISGTLYELDTNAFRLTVMQLLDNEDHIFLPIAFSHNTEVTLGGETFARTIEVINGYSLTFENLVYSVRMAGSNNNFFDVDNNILNPSGNVTVIGRNSAGLLASPDITRIHNDMGLNLSGTKVITENVADSDYTEVNADGVTKTVVKSGATTTIDRTV